VLTTCGHITKTPWTEPQGKERGAMQDSGGISFDLSLDLGQFLPLEQDLWGEGFKQGFSKWGSWTSLSPSTQCVFEI